MDLIICDGMRGEVLGRLVVAGAVVAGVTVVVVRVVVVVVRVVIVVVDVVVVVVVIVAGVAEVVGVVGYRFVYYTMCLII